MIVLQTSWSELQTGVIAEPVLDHLAPNWNVWWNRSWLVASVSFALQKKRKKERNQLCFPPVANKIKESSCGLSLANKDRQKLKYVNLQQNHGKKTCILTWICTAEAVVDVLSQHGLPSSVTPASYRMTPATKAPSAWNSEARHHHPEAAIAQLLQLCLTGTECFPETFQWRFMASAGRQSGEDRALL